MSQPLLRVVSCRAQAGVLGSCQVHHLLHNHSSQFSTHISRDHDLLQQARDQTEVWSLCTSLRSKCSGTVQTWPDMPWACLCETHEESLAYQAMRSL